MRSKYENEYSIQEFNKNSFSKQLYAYDLSYDLKEDGELDNSDVIKQRISTTLTTIPTERFFNNKFGTTLYNIIFNNPTNQVTADFALGVAINDIQKWVKGISINKDNSHAKFEGDDAILLYIEFTIDKTDELHNWQEIIYF